ncbi:MAG: cell envelope integrity protein TolA [Alphaproteobacteria bacterium]|nr:cell envelope integrity protein TolA [Alphaproteobacteria bacterium]
MKQIKGNFYELLGIGLIPPFLKDGLVISFILHIFFLVLIMVSPYIRIHSFIPKVKYDEPIIVDLDNLVIGKETILPPAPPTKQKEETKKEYFKPEVKKEELPPPPAPKEKVENKKDSTGDFIEETKKEDKKEMPKQKDITKERMGGLDDLLASVDGLKRNEKNVKEKNEKKLEEKTAEVKKGVEAIDFGSKNYQQNSAQDFLKKQMAVSYIDAIRIKLRSCWNLDPGAKDIKNMKIVIRTSISPDGNINSIEILNKEEYLSSPWFKAVAESAKRALIICSPYSLPLEFYQDWKDIVFTFYPDKKSVQ